VSVAELQLTSSLLCFLRSYSGLTALNQHLPLFHAQKISDFFAVKREYSKDAESNSERLGYNLAFTLPKVYVAQLEMQVSKPAANERAEEHKDLDVSGGIVQFSLSSMPGTGTDNKKPKQYTVSFWAELHDEEVGKVLGAHCTCCAGRVGTCKHVAALMYLVNAIKPDLTCTDKLMEWQMSHCRPYNVREPVYLLRVANHEKNKVKVKRSVTAGDGGRHNHSVAFTPHVDPIERGEMARRTQEARLELFTILAAANEKRNPYTVKGKPP
jgi:hypothetical protein